VAVKSGHRRLRASAGRARLFKDAFRPPKHPLRLGLTGVGALLALWALFIALGIAAAAVPDDAVVTKLRDAAQAGELTEHWPPGPLGGQGDGWTECVVFGTGLAPEGTSLIERQATAPFLGNCEELTARIAQEPPDLSIDGRYYRYWMGSVVWDRPILAAMGLGALRALTGVALFAALGWALLQFHRLGQRGPSAALVFLVLTTDFMVTPWSSQQGALGLAAALGVAGAAAWAARRSGRDLFLVTLAAAAVFNWIDLLTNPPLAWALIALVWILAARRRGLPPRAQVCWGAFGAATWAVAYALTWLARWCLTAPVLGWRRVFTNALDRVAFRAGSGAEGIGWPGDVAAAVGKQFYHWAALPGGAVGLAVAAILLPVVWTVAARSRRDPLDPDGTGTPGQTLKQALALASPALLVLIWFVLVAEHSLVHGFFTYRALALAVGILLAAPLTALGGRIRPRAPRSRDRV
jgi:hypothetical protein